MDKYSGIPKKYYWEEYLKFGFILKISKNTLTIQKKILVKPKKKVLTQFWLKNLEQYSTIRKIL